ncbi:MAG: outer membrane beta-barrel protein [Bacteroidaceae bacterium]|nr:outer membrane beta-barrel protein [Bacteroidaceae bacterium]
MKRIFSSIVFASLAIASFAGGLLTNTNQSAAFVRNPARYASLDADAVYFNPAGTAFLQEGWTVSANWQMIWQDRDVLNAGKEYKGEVYVPIMPTFHAIYKTGDWAFSAFFGMPGGGGNAQFDNGLPVFDQLAPGLFTQAFNQQTQGYGTINSITNSSQFESTQYLFALQLGAAYKINDNFSVYGGIRANYTSLSYEGAITGNINGNVPYIPEGATVPIMVTTDIPVNVGVDLTQTGIAFAPIIGIDYKVDRFNLGVKYEFRAVNIIENDTKDAPAAFASLQDGVKFRNDAPAILSVGASYDICDRVKVMGAGVYYFDKDAKIESLLTKENTMQTLSRNTYELLAGVEVKVTDKLLLSSGIQFSDFGVNSSYLSDVSFIDDSFTVGAGGKYSFNENWDLNFGACYANYAHGAGATGSHYLRKTYNVAVGVDFRF